MSDWINMKLVRQYQNERLKEVAHYQLVQEAKAANQSKPIYAPTLAMVGGWLVAWGSQLQAHYGNIADNINSSVSSDDCGCGESLLPQVR
jgi:hypothetical protein